VKRILFLLAAGFFVLGGASTVQAYDKTTSFGALDTMSAETAKTKLTTWLKAVGKGDAATLQKLDAVWKDKDQSILDRVAASFALGDPVAAKLLAEARDNNGPAPIVVPSVFKDEKQSAFYRANMGLIYSRALVNRRVYEEALATLKLFSPEQMVDPASYLFHRAVCEHAMLQKPEATKSITRLFAEAAQLAPERYKTVATLMLMDMLTWKDKSLGDIARKMENIERRLEIARGGPETQRQQREVLNRLDEMIKKMENKKKKGDGSGDPKPGSPGQPGEDECPDGGGKPGPSQPGGPPQGIQPPTGPAGDFAVPPGNGGTGNTTKTQFKKLEAEWDHLPPRERERALQDLTTGMSPRHREAVENYFRNITTAVGPSKK
jgi:hypothetical protein